MNRINFSPRLLASAVALLWITLFLSGCGEKGPSVDRLLADAKQERSAGKNNSAVIHLKNLLQKAPENGEARYLLGATYLEMRDFRAAETELRRALDLKYEPTLVVPALGKSLLSIGEFQKVLDQTRLEGNPPNPVQAEILTLRALASIGLTRTQEGRDMLDQALVKQPEFPDALLGLARLAASEKKLPEAAALVERALASAPKNVEALLMKGDLARTMADPAAAFAAYNKAAELSPENNSARLNIASLHIASGDLDSATKEIEQARKISPNSPLAVYMKALVEFRQKNYPAARETVAQVLKAAPNHMPSVLLSGAVDFALGSHAQAQSSLTRVLAASPTNLYARKLLVASLAKSGQAPRAVELLQPALTQAPEDGALMALAGEVYMQNNEFPKAVQFFEKAAKLDPKSAGVRTELGLSRLAAGENERAVADLESAGQLDETKFQSDILLVMSHLQRAQYDQALKALAGLEKKQPSNPLTYNLKAAIFIGKKDIPGARTALEKALELQPTYVPAAMNLAQLDLQDKNPQAARRRLEAILEKGPGNSQALLALANLAPRLGATGQQQIDWLEGARKANPGAAEPQVLLAQAYLRSGNPKKALEVAQQAAAAFPASAEVLATLGGVQLGAGEQAQALATYGKLVTLQPKSPVALYRLATAQAANSEQANAVSSLKKALALKGDFVDAQAALVGLEVRAGRYPQALQIAQQVQKQAAKSPAGFILEGDVMMAEKKYPQAAKAYDTAYGLGKSGSLAVKLHAAYSQAGRPDEADARLNQWLKESPDDVNVRAYAGESGIRRGKFKDAIVHYEWLQKMQPDNLLVLNNLAWAYQQVKDPRALETAERAYKLNPDNAAIADTLGWMLVEQGNTTRGVDLLQKAVAAAPKSPEIRYHLAQAWAKAGDKSKAVPELERLLAGEVKFPQYDEALALLKRLRN